MEKIILNTSVIKRNEDNTVYLEFVPTNLGLEGLVTFCVTDTIDVNIESCIERQRVIALDGIYTALEEKFPGVFTK